MAEIESEQLLAEIGEALMEDREYPSEPTLLYAQVGNNVTGQSIFKELDDQVLFRMTDNERLTDALLDLWDAQEEQERWSELEYVLRDGRFDVVYFYPDEIDPEEDVVERRRRAVRRLFGEKPIVFPPFDLDDDVPSYKL